MNYISKINLKDILYSIKSKFLEVQEDTLSEDNLPVFFGKSQENNNYDIRYNTNITIKPSTGVLMGAAWNDYAEYRKFEGIRPKAGMVVCETGEDSVKISNKRLEPAPSVVSDTFGFIIGEKKDSIPISVCGKVLVYPNEDINKYRKGDAFCSGPNGTVSKMTREEIVNFPDRILGYFVGIPKEKQINNIAVNNRFWLKIK